MKICRVCKRNKITNKFLLYFGMNHIAKNDKGATEYDRGKWFSVPKIESKLKDVQLCEECEIAVMDRMKYMETQILDNINKE